ncbi:MAG: NAD+ synthase [Bacteroidetes bacterium]|nr:NAD+ synthase [Bacteroidota bacterium]
MKIALAQLNVIIGDFDYNFRKMAKAIDEAVGKHADLIVFPELAVCGYPPRDFLEFRDFVGRSQKVVQNLAGHAGDRIAVVVGAPTVNPDPEGKDLFNSGYFIEHGKIKYIAHKTLLPTYDIFDEYRYFEPVSDYKVIEFKGKRIALTICEDIWNIGNENPLYKVCPMDEMMPQQPDLIINLSASPFSYKQAKERIAVVKANAERYRIPVFYCNHVGAQTEILFDGGSLVVAANSRVVDEMPYWKEAIGYYDLDEVAAIGKQSGQDNDQPKSEMDLIHHGVVTGVKDYFGKLGFKKAILGLSGGIDSALTLALAAEALGSENVLAVMMPSQFSSDHSISDSEQLVKNLGCPSRMIPVERVYKTCLGELEEHFEGKPFGLAEENLQARIRGIYLMSLSNKHGHILLNTSNKSEAAVGYGTLYGDMCGGLSVIGDLYKTQVFALCRHLNEVAGYELIPENIITKPPSAELRPDQFDSDTLPDYDILDEVLFEYIEKRLGPEEIIANGFDADLVRRILRLVNRNEFKRYQTPPMIRVSPKAFGMGRRMPIVAKYLD